jgi:uncharacterized membrane protein YedE/YeeE
MATGFVILLIVVGGLALAAWPICVVLARRQTYARPLKRQPRTQWPDQEQPHGTVLGGSHVGGGRSVSPRRDEAVVPGQRGQADGPPR